MDQIQCVVKHRLEELQEAIELQNAVNSTINALEDELRQALILSFNSIKVKMIKQLLVFRLVFVYQREGRGAGYILYAELF